MNACRKIGIRPLTVAGFVLVGAIVFPWLHRSETERVEEKDMAMMHADHAPDAHAPEMDHVHSVKEWEGETEPTVSLTVTPDAKSGWNVHIATTGFRFAPERASLEHRRGEGHAHLFVNGEKITRVYGEWYYLAALPEGENTISVDLNANDHSPYVILGHPIADTVTVTAPRS